MKKIIDLLKPIQTGMSRKIVQLLFLFGVAPLLILSALFMIIYIPGELRHTREIHKEIVERIASDLSGHIEDRINHLRLFAVTSNLMNINKEKAETLTYTLFDMVKEFDMIALADTKGRVVGRYSRYYSFRPSELGSLEGDPSFLSALKGEMHISGIEISTYTQLPYILVTIPARDSATGRITGILQVSVNIGRMWELISSHQIGTNRDAYIVDRTGRLIIHKEIAAVLRKKDVSDIGVVKHFMDDQTGVFHYRGLNGSLVVGASSSIRLLRWGVIMEEPVRSAYRGTFTISLFLLLLTLLTITLAVIIGVRFSFRFIVDPIKRLQEGTEAIAGGQFDRKVHVEGADEVGRLAETFNAMAENLQTTMVSRDRLAEEVEERKRVEKELRKAYEDLQDTKDMLVQTEKLAAIGKLAAGAAHEIRNPLSIMSLRIQFLEMTDILPAKTAETLKIVHKQIERITHVIEGLRQFSRTPQKVEELHNLNEIMEDVLAIQAPALKAEDVQLETTYEAHMPPILMDREKIEHALVNILSNALDAMRGCERRTLKVSTVLHEKENGERLIRIVISDTGHGIKPEDLSRLFDPFFTTKGPDKGTGLGLSIAYGIIQDHEGTVWVENNESGGASFFVELPVKEPAAHERNDLMQKEGGS